MDAVMNLPIAHASHWLIGLLYILPVVVLGVGVAWQKYRDRQTSD